MEDNHSDSVNDTYKLRTTFIIDPHNFWAQLGPERQLADFHLFEESIHEHCEAASQSHQNSCADFPTDQLVFVKSPDQKKWLRAEVVRTLEDMLDVFYPDYGTTELVPRHCVCWNVPLEFKTNIHYAYRCQLAGIKPISKSWTTRAVRSFKSLAQEKILDAVVFSNIYGTAHVALFTGPEHEHRSVTHILLEEEVGLEWGIENVPEFSYQVSPSWFEKVFSNSPSQVSDNTSTEKDESSATDTDTSASVASPDNSEEQEARIPSFDTTAIDTSHVTVEMLKIKAVMEYQEKNRTEIKRQMKDMTADLALEKALYGGPVEEDVKTEVTDDIVNEIHSQIREAESSGDTDLADGAAGDGLPLKKVVGPVAHKSRTNGVTTSHRQSPNRGRGRARNKSRSSSNSPVPGGNGRRADPVKIRLKEEEYSRSCDERAQTPDVHRNGKTEAVWEKGLISPKEFNKKLTMILNKIEEEGLGGHQQDFEDLIVSNKNKGKMRDVLEAVLEKAIRFHETFSSAAVTLLSVCQGLEDMEDSLSPVLYKLQSKYVRVHPKQVYYHENYSKVLGELFVSSSSWKDSACLPLRLCVVNSLQKWVIFNKKRHQPHSDALHELYLACFVELWERVQASLRSSMTSEWELIVDEMRERVELDVTPRRVRKQLLDTLLTSYKTAPITEPSPSVSDMGCQISWESVEQSTQTPVPDHTHFSCQVKLSPEKSSPSPTYKKQEFLISPAHFFVPKMAPGSIARSPSLSPPFSYAAAVHIDKQKTGDDKPKAKSGLTMRNIAKELLSEPFVPTTSLQKLNRDSPNPNAQVQPPSSSRGTTPPLVSSAWGKDKPSKQWAVDSEEFPSLKEAEQLRSVKPKPEQPVNSVQTEPKSVENESSCVKQSSDSQFAFSSSGDDSDEDDWFEKGAKEFPAVARAAKPPPERPAWKPGLRKCSICGDPDHLVYDCPNKHKSFFFSQ